MGILAYIILLAILGLIVGGLGRLLLPGPDPMTTVQTIMIGIVASYVRRYRQSSWSQPGPPGPRRF